MPKLTKIKGSLSFMQNGQVQNRDGISFSLPSLKSTGSLTLQSVSEVSLDSLKTINGNFDVSLCTMSILGFENLEHIDGSLSIYDNINLSNLKFPNLVSVHNILNC